MTRQTGQTTLKSCNNIHKVSSANGTEYAENINCKHKHERNHQRIAKKFIKKK